jgi:DNA-binding response OmpR family regulator
MMNETDHVLVVDDDRGIRELVGAYLEKQGLRVTLAANGREMRNALMQGTPDLILLDIMMPRMSGFGVCQKLKADPATRDIQILMVTALNELGDIERATDCGTDDFISKPVNKFELLIRVKNMLRVRHLKNELERALTYLGEVEQEAETDLGEETDPKDQKG